MGPCGKGWADPSGRADPAREADSVTGSASSTATSSDGSPHLTLSSMVPVPVPVPNRTDCVYTSHYCEENVLCLFRDMAQAAAGAGATLHVVFVSNHARQVPVWCQVLADHHNKPVLWDYHVLLLAQHPHGNWIYDLDSTLPFPTPASHYMRHAFHSGTSMDNKYLQVFRVVPALECFEHFASNRSHMRSQWGEYSAKPPDHPPLRGVKASSDHNMEEWISMNSSTGRGRVLSLLDMEHFVAQPSQRFS